MKNLLSHFDRILIFAQIHFNKRPEKKNGSQSLLLLRDIVNERKFDSFSLICDIEGYEFDVVLNDAEVLRKASTIILETHARFIEAKTAQLLTRLEDLGFR